MEKTKIIVLTAGIVVLAALLAAVVYAQPLLNPNTATPKTGTFSQQLPSSVSSAGTYGTYGYGSYTVTVVPE